MLTQRRPSHFVDLSSQQAMSQEKHSASFECARNMNDAMKAIAHHQSRLQNVDTDNYWRWRSDEICGIVPDDIQ